MTPEPTAIGIAVVEWRGCFLIGRRPAGRPLAGLWEFPGGRVEPGESPSEAAWRECLEETGLSVTVVDRYAVSQHEYAHGAVRLYFFACHPLDAELQPRAPFRWVPRHDLVRYSFPEGNREILRILAGSES